MMASPLRAELSDVEMKELILGTLEDLSDKIRASIAPKQMLVNTEEAARILSLSPAYLEQLRKGCKGPAYRKIGGAVRYSPSDLAAWVDKQDRRGL